METWEIKCLRREKEEHDIPALTPPGIGIGGFKAFPTSTVTVKRYVRLGVVVGHVAAVVVVVVVGVEMAGLIVLRRASKRDDALGIGGRRSIILVGGGILDGRV